MKRILKEVEALAGAGAGKWSRAVVDGGEIDRWLGGGLARGRVHAAAGSSATAFAVLLCARLRGPVLWCTVKGGVLSDLYPPGLAGFGLDPERLVVARAADEAEALGAAEAGLRQPGLAAVVAETARGLPPVRGRRLQLAARAGGGFGLVLMRSAGETAWAESGWEIVPMPGEGAPRWRWTLRRARRARPHAWLVEWGGATDAGQAASALRVVSPAGG